MSIIQAYKSDSDGEIFEHLKDYQKHLKMLARENRHFKKLENEAKEKKAILLKMSKEIETFEQLSDFIMSHAGFFTDKKAPNTTKIHSFTFSESPKSVYTNLLKWNKDIPTTFCSPMDTLIENKKEYGWTGAMLYVWSEQEVDFKGTTVHPGSGGNIGKLSEQYMTQKSVTLFAKDFLKLSYCEMIKNFQETRQLDMDRLKFVIQHCAQCFNYKNKEFNEVLVFAHANFPDKMGDILDNYKKIIQQKYDTVAPAKSIQNPVVRVKI